MPKAIPAEVKEKILKKFKELKDDPKNSKQSDFLLCKRASGRSGVNVETIRNWVKALKKGARKIEKTTSAQKLTDELELQIVACCLFFANIHRPLKPIEISWIAFQLSDGKCFGGNQKVASFDEWGGRFHWAKKFLTRHKSQLITDSGQPIVESRTNAEIPDQVLRWIVRAKDDLQDQDPRFLYNLDEASITFFGKKAGEKFVFSKSDKRHNIKQPRYTNQGSYLPIVAANGDLVCSLWVLRQDQNNFDAAKWLLPQTDDVPRFFVFNKTGKVTKAIFSQFLTYLQPVLLARMDKLEPNWRQLGLRHKVLLDNVSCHYVTMMWQKLAQNHIDCVFLPKNTTHFLQPLDNVYFKNWRAHLSKRAGLATLLDTPGENVKVYSSLVSFAQEAERDMTVESVQKSFANTGMHPFNPVKIGTLLREVFRPGEPEPTTDKQKTAEKLHKIMQIRVDTSALKENAKKRKADDKIEVAENEIYDAEDLLNKETKRHKKDVNKEKIEKMKREAKTEKERAKALKMERNALVKLAKFGCFKCKQVIRANNRKYMTPCKKHAACQIKFCDVCVNSFIKGRYGQTFESLHEESGPCPKILIEIEETKESAKDNSDDEYSEGQDGDCSEEE